MQIEIESVSCDLCGSNNCSLRYKIPDIRFMITNQEFSVVKCKTCGHIYLDPRPVETDLIKCYPNAYYNYRGKEIPNQNDRYARQANYFNHIRLGRFLDIGCARGAFLETMNKIGWDCYGMDIYTQNEKDLPKNINYQFGSLEKIGYPPDYFDAISAWGVFEHLVSPKKYYISVAKILKKNGLFVMMVPNAHSLWSCFAYKEDIPRHLHFFTTSSIRKYAKVANLKVLKFEFTNHIYSRPATGREGFRINLLKAVGVSWQEINKPQTKLYLRMISSLGTFLGKMLIHPRLEELLGISGMIVVRFTK